MERDEADVITEQLDAAMARLRAVVVELRTATTDLEQLIAAKTAQRPDPQGGPSA